MTLGILLLPVSLSSILAYYDQETGLYMHTTK